MSDWRTFRVAELAPNAPNALATGPFGSSIGSRFFKTSGIPVIRGSNLSVDPAVRLSDENLVFLSPEKAAEFSRSIVRSGDLVFTSWGTINQVGLIDDTARYLEYVISNKQMKLTPDPAVAVPEYLYHLFSSPVMQQEILDGSIGSSVPGFNLTRLRSIEVHLPPVEEQRQIVAGLRDTDQFVEALSRLITKTEAIKQGMTQELLTGRTRLLGFTEPWTTHRLDELGVFLKGRGIKRDDVRSTGVPCIRYGELYTDFHDYTDTPVSHVSRTVAQTALSLVRGDLLFAGSGETRKEIGMCVAFLGTVPTVAGGDIVVLRSDKFNPVYAGTLLNTQRLAEQKARLGQGDAVVHISSRALGSLTIDLPPLAEQGAIALVVMDIDSEIDTLRRRLAKAKSIKQGMAQQLLTGRVRLPVLEEAVA